MQRIVSALLMLLMALTATAQPGGNRKFQASGHIIDSRTSEPLISATVQAHSADGSTGTFAITDTTGLFTLEVPRPGKYTLTFSYVGYKELVKDVNIWPGRAANLGNFKLEEDPEYLEEVVTVGRAQRMKQVGDTVMYNADAYKVQEGATAEELVAKMPGIEVTDEGVKAQGETVEKITVDGKAFFENDPKLALKTLPAEVVQQVKVFDQKSDQAEFTGFDDGETVKAMDLATKSYRRNGVFGKVYGSLGTDLDWDNLYYNAGFNLNFFTPRRRISVLAMTNNANQQDFTFDDLQSSGGMGGRGGRFGNRVGSQSGVSRASAFGINYNENFLDDKLEVQGSYFFNGTRTTLSDSVASDYINTARSTVQTDDALSHNYSHRLEMRLRYRVNDYNEIIFRPTASFQKTDRSQYTETSAWRHSLDSVMNYSRIYNDFQNQTSTLTDSKSDSWNAGFGATWRHRFEKAGRTLSMGANLRFSGSDSEADYVKRYSYKTAADFQGSDSDTKGLRTSGNLQWTEPIDSTQQLSFRYDIGYTRSENERFVGYYDDDSFSTLDSVDARNSSDYISRYLTNSVEAGWRISRGQIRANASLAFQNARLKGEQVYDYWNTATMGADTLSYTTSKSFNSLLPNARIEWRPQDNIEIELRYRASSSNPSVSNLQQSVNTSNELSYSTGNPDLDQSVSHDIRLRAMYTNVERATNLMVWGSYSTRQDYIGTQYLTNNSSSTVALNTMTGYSDSRFNGLNLVSGARISRPVNMSGYQSASLGVVYGFPWDLIYSNVNFGMDANFGITPSQQIYYEGTDSRGNALYTDLTTKVRQYTLTPRLHISSNISSDLDFSLSYNPSYQKVNDAENTSNNYEYFTNRASARLNWTFWRGFTMEQQLNWTSYNGTGMDEVRDTWIWNMSLGKKFLRNKAEIKLQAYDLLNSNKGFSRSVSDTYIRTSYVNYMPRYVMLTFSYRISAYKGSSEMKERGGRGGRGGFGGGPM